jgi:hypothetical protein
LRLEVPTPLLAPLAASGGWLAVGLTLALVESFSQPAVLLAAVLSGAPALLLLRRSVEVETAPAWVQGLLAASVGPSVIIALAVAWSVAAA